MLGPKTDNSVIGSKDVTQIGHNSGTINTGLTFEQHEENVQRRLGELRADLERAHGAERALLQREFDAVQGKLANLQADYQANLAELADLKQTLAQYHNQIDADARRLADAALDRGDRSLARVLLTELSAKAQARHADAAEEAAGLEFKLGEIAEAEVRWADAAAHYARAANLHPTLWALHRATNFTQLAGNYPRAQRFAQEYLDMARAGGDPAELSRALDRSAIVMQRLGQFTAAEAMFREALDIAHETQSPDHSSFAALLNNLAGVVEDQGRYKEAEALYKMALDIGRRILGDGHPDIAINLNNLASVVQAQGRYGAAEVLFKMALEIGLKTLGEGHPDIATRMNNLASVVWAQGRYSEAERLYVQALEIDRKTIGEDHPDFAIRLNNLSAVLMAQGRYDAADGLYRQALEIDRRTIGEAHPRFGEHLGNLGQLLGEIGRKDEARPMLQQSLDIFRAALPADHPYTGEAARRLAELDTP